MTAQRGHFERPADPSRLMLTPEQRADDAVPDLVLEVLAVHLYETDWESSYNDGDQVQWRDNYAHRDRYRDLARAALEFVHMRADERRPCPHGCKGGHTEDEYYGGGCPGRDQEAFEGWGPGR